MSTPFRGEQFTFSQPDGSEVDLIGWGDQHYAVFETLDGYTVWLDPATGYYQYATLSDDQTRLMPTGARVGVVDPTSLGLAKSIRITPEAAKADAAAARSAGGERPPRWEERRQARIEAERAALSGPIPFAPPSHVTTGTYVGLCLLIEFPDVPGTISRQEVDDFCNKPGYDGFDNNGSVFDYFLEVSNERMRYSNTVVDYYTAVHPRSYYTDESIAQPIRARELIREALTDLMTTSFDFSRLTADSGGLVHALNIFYAGRRVNNWAKGLWPHSFHLGSTVPLAPGRSAFDYQFTDMGPELTLKTFCHENGHMVCDFPDLYDYGYQSEGTGLYCLMCSGGPDKKNPTHVGGYLKYKAGWADSVTPVSSGLNATISGEDDQFFIHTKNPLEYFLIENRVAAGRDGSLPSSGLAIWHVDEKGSNNNEHMTETQHYEASVEQADGNFDLEKRINTGDAFDLFRESVNDAFGAATTPSSKWWDGTLSGLEIREISAPGDVMTFSIPGGVADEIQVSASPAVEIPDNDTFGVQDVISIDETGQVGSMTVAVDIDHTYRGDLRVTLIAPSGVAVILHERRGGGADDLKTTFDSSTTPGLKIMSGEEINGDWVLRVHDLAAVDTGTFSAWELTILPASDDHIRLEESPGVSIPDNDPTGIERTLAATETGTVEEVSVALDITHSYISDLIVSLISPAGTAVDLHHRAGGSADNIIETYTVASTPLLDSIRGEQIEGDWSLRVSDRAGLDLGKLNRWELTILPGS